MHEIVPGIYVWHWFAAHFGYDFNGHLAGDVCIDPVDMPDAILDDIVARGVARIVLTNRNHFRAAEKVRARTRATVAIHPADAAFVRDRGVAVGAELRAGERVGPFVVVAAPGKSPGEVALHWPERRLLVVGDACIGNPAGKLSLLPEKVMDDPARLRASLRRIAETVDFDTILCGDGEPILSGARAALLTLCASFPT